MRANDVPIDSIKEVKEYEDAKEMVETFVERHQSLFSAYFALIDTLNQKREAADKIVRARGVSCGDWELYNYQTTVNAEAMYNALGMESFLALGGTTTTKTVFGADKAKVEAAIARGDIPQDLGSTIIEKSPRYHAPKG